MVAVMCCVLMAATQAAAEVTNIRNSSVVRDEKIIKVQPIVINTQQQHYEQPTLQNYQECFENHDKCMKVCATATAREACEKQCIICPILIDEKMTVQGINDTNIHMAASATVNTTNIIRLTNEIRNIIDNHQGNLTYNNDNLVKIQQNVTSKGGEFGLGFNNTKPCCIVVSTSRNCDSRQFSTAARCHQKRHRVCGEQCTAHVMMAKIVTVCENTMDGTASGTDDEDFAENCHETIKYVPYRKSKRTASKCHYTPNWPYVICPQKRESSHAGRINVLCRKCQQMPYFQILRFGMPQQCGRCFGMGMGMGMGMGGGMGMGMGGGMGMVGGMGYPMYPWSPYGPPMMDNGFDEFPMDNDYPHMGGFDDGWHQDKIKCKLPNGTITEDCNDEGSGGDELILPTKPKTESPLENLPEAQDYDDYEGDDYSDDYLLPSGPVVRRRRQIKNFQRSKYSRRFRN